MAVSSHLTQCSVISQELHARLWYILVPRPQFSHGITIFNRVRSHMLQCSARMFIHTSHW